MKIKMNEIGRSMVEMLGILAVIGVLSVGGIIGYKFAMNKYIANETMYELNIRATDISQRMEKLISINHAGEIDMEMGPVMRMGYPITARMSPQYTDYFEIFISDVPTEICKLLLQSQWQAPYSIFIGITEYEASIDICSQAEKVELAYEFYKDITLNASEVPEDKGHKIRRCNYDTECACATCEDGLCVSICPEKSECVKSYDDPRLFVCCKKENVVGNYCCASVTADGKCCSANNKCCPPDKPMQDKNGNCYSCTTTSVIVTPTGECSICPNRFLVDNGWAQKGCGAPCPPEKPLRQYNGECFTCDTDSDVNVVQDFSACNVCMETGERVRSDKWCKKACTGTTPMMDTGGKCQSCEYNGVVPLSAIPQGKTCSGLCPNREEQGTNCVLKTCPTEKPMEDKNGGCHACDETAVILVPNNDCSACENRFLVDNGWAQKGCGAPCPPEKPLRQYNGECFTCDTDSDVNVVQDFSACNVCMETGERVRSDKWCKKACTGTTPMMDTGGKCQSCEYNGVVPLSAIPQGKTCSGLCPNREEQGTNCVLKTCPTEKPMEDKNGGCHACDETAVILVPNNDCSACENRFLVDNGWGQKGCGAPCSEEKPLRQYDGTCFDCNTPTSVNVIQDYSACDVCPNRMMSGKFCERMSCLPGTFAGSDGICYKCNISTDIDVSTDTSQCDLCMNSRELQGTKCVWIGS